MEESQGVSNAGEPDITQFLSVHMAEDDIIKVEEPLICDFDGDMQDDEGSSSWMKSYSNFAEVDTLGNSLISYPKDEILNIGSECNICGKRFSKSKMKIHMRTHTGEKPYQCDICNKSFARSDKLVTHKRIHTGEKPHSCFCGKQFRRIDHLRDHIYTHDVDVSVREAVIEKAKKYECTSRGANPRLPPNTSLKCPDCSMTFSQSYKYKRHLRVHTGEKPYVCFCGNSYTRAEGLRRHQLSIHGSDKLPMRFVSSVELNDELLHPYITRSNNIIQDHSQTSEKVDALEESGENGDTNNKEENLLTFKNPASDEVSVENKRSQKESIEQEEAKAQNELCHTSKCCHICGKYVSRSRMRVHLRTHTGEKPFQCEICSKRFARSDKLTCHRRIHTGEKPHVCFCGKRFSRIDHMKMHAASHKVDEGQLSTMLEEAKKQDFLARGLSLPLQSYSHKCSYCGQIFEQSYKYERHLQTHTGEKPYACFCGCRYSRLERLRRHQIKCHDLTENEQSATEDPLRVIPEVILDINQPEGSSYSQEINQNGLLELNECATEPENKTQAISLPLGDCTEDTVEHVMRDVVVEQVKQPKQKLIKKNGMYCCEFCPKTFKKAHKLGLHRRTHTGEKPHLCESCGKAFARKDHMLKHMNTHIKRRRDSLLNTMNSWMEEQDLSSFLIEEVKIEEEPLDLGETKEENTDESVEEESLKKEDTEDFHVCPVCGHAFKKVYNLQSHMQIHTERSTFDCGVCSKQFKVKKNYEAHLLNHETEMDLSQELIENTDLNKARSQRAQCPVCGKWVVSVSSLATHMRSHTGERPFQCAICEHTFIRKADMYRHMKSHSGERPYQCEHCSATFSRKDKLVFHLRKHEGLN